MAHVTAFEETILPLGKRFEIPYDAWPVAGRAGKAPRRFPDAIERQKTTTWAALLAKAVLD